MPEVVVEIEAPVSPSLRARGPHYKWRSAMFIVRGAWVAIQSNGWRVTFDLDQFNGNELRGQVTARHPTHSKVMKGAGEGKVSPGPVTSGHQFSFEVSWHGEGRATYVGTFGLDERLTGVTFSPDNVGEQASWFSDRTFVIDS